MNAPLRRVGIIVMIMFGLLFANLNWVQAYKADEYRTSEYNCRTRIAEYERARGIIAVGRDAQAAAVSTAVEDLVAGVCDTFVAIPFLREYPFGELYAHVIGYQSIELTTFGVENFQTEFLAGTADALFVDRIRDLFSGGDSPGGNVLTTLSGPAQQTAFDELRNNGRTDKGAVVALDPRTGAVQAMVSLPAFDPTPLAVPDRQAALDTYNELNENPDQPLINRALRIDDIDERTGEGANFFPGSVMKVIVSAAALQNGFEPDTEIQGGAQYTAPTAGAPIGNAPGVDCPDELSLQEALTVSCNTAFSRLAAEGLGGDVLLQTAQAFGFGDEELTVGELGGGGLPVTASAIGNLKRPDDGQDDPPTVALSAIGQGSVQVSPMQAAMIAATVANGGAQMHPYLVEQLQDSQLRPVYQASPDELRRPMSAQDASQLRDMMVSVVQNGTGRNAQIEGLTVGGKTGTAEAGGANEIDHGWFIGFAIDSDGTPVSAVAVMLENAGSGGSAEAARIGGQVMRAVISDRGED